MASNDTNLDMFKRWHNEFPKGHGAVEIYAKLVPKKEES